MGTAILAMMIVGGWGLWVWSLRVEGKDPTRRKKMKKKDAVDEPTAPHQLPGPQYHSQEAYGAPPGQGWPNA